METLQVFKAKTANHAPVYDVVITGLATIRPQRVDYADADDENPAQTSGFAGGRIRFSSAFGMP